MLNNKEIVEKIREVAKQMGLMSDAAIFKKCGISNRMVFHGILNSKTSPQLRTLDKIARGLGVNIEDLVYSRTDADLQMAKLWPELTEYEKTEAVVYVKMMLKEKNEKNVNFSIKVTENVTFKAHSPLF